MPFGLSNAPSVFQHFMNAVFHDLLDSGVNIYLDDIIISSRDPTEHTQLVRRVLLRLREHRLYAKAEKCQFHKSSIEFLGFIISPQCISMDQTKVQAVLDWPAPGNLKELQRFLGFSNFYRKFIHLYSQIVLPLTMLTRRSQPFVWSAQAQTAFTALKRAFTTAPVLAIFNPTLPITLETDASDFAMGAVLSQASGTGPPHPVAFFSRKFQASEINYPVHEKEMLAIIVAVREWRHYLQGSPHPITILTDHRNLQFFLKAPLQTRRHCRWFETLAPLNFRLHYRPGRLNNAADALSRRPDHALHLPPPPAPTLLQPSHFSSPEPKTLNHPTPPQNPKTSQAPPSSTPLMPTTLLGTYTLTDPMLHSTVAAAQRRDPFSLALLNHLLDHSPPPDIPN